MKHKIRINGAQSFFYKGKMGKIGMMGMIGGKGGGEAGNEELGDGNDCTISGNDDGDK